MPMQYKKPSIRYVDMCIYIDNIMSEWYTTQKPLTIEQEDNIYKYIYHLYYNMACKKRWLLSVDQYNDYALFCAGKAFVRLLDKRQFTGELTPIKSILNYIKATGYGWKEKWRMETYQQVLDVEYTPNFDPVIFKQTLIDNYESGKKEEKINKVKDIFNLIPLFIKQSLDSLNGNLDIVTYNNLKLSCILTFNYNLPEIVLYKTNYRIKQKPEKIIYWKLSTSYNNIIKLVINKCKILLKDELKDIVSTFNLSENDLNNLLWSATTSDITSDLT